MDIRSRRSSPMCQNAARLRNLSPVYRPSRISEQEAAMRSVILAVLVVFVAGRAQAQELAGTLDQLRVLVKPGEQLTVTDTAGKSLRGRLTQLDDSSLVLEDGKHTYRFGTVDIERISRRGGDSVGNGASIGLAIGAVFGAGVAISVGETLYAIPAGLVYGGLGAGIGVGIDALIRGQRLVYVRSKTTLSLAPIISRERKGVMLTLQRSS